MTIFSLTNSGVSQRPQGAVQYTTGSPNPVDRKSSRSTVTLSARTGFATSYSTRSIDRSEGTRTDEVGIDSELALLQRAVVREDTRGFAEAVGRLDWTTREAEDFAYVAELAILAGAEQVARRLAEEGALRFPGDRRLGRFAEVLAPPVVVARRPVSSSTAAERLANTEWLRKNSASYAGRWVALRAGALVAEGKTARDVAALLGELKRQQVLITQIS